MSEWHDDWCERNKCEHYTEWEYSDNEYDQPYNCISCNLVGQSYHIDIIPSECPYKKDSAKEVIIVGIKNEKNKNI
jgi:hypothetical protein